jgi:predicted dehydrogenase
MQIRTAAVSQKVMELIREGRIGTVRLVQCFDMVGRSGGEFRHTRSRRKDMIKSWTLAKGVHFLDLCNFFMDDEPVRVFASGARDVFGGDKPNDLHCPECEIKAECQWEGAKATIGGIPYPVKNSLCVFAKEVDVNDNCAAVIDYRRGGRVSYTESYFTPEYQTLYDIVGEKGAISCRYAMDERNWVRYRKRGTATIEHFEIFNTEGGGHGGGDYRIIKLIADAVRKGEQMRPNILDGRNAVAVCEAIDRSIETRQPVEIPPPPAL